MFEKILIANRGEIAVRIIRACRELKIKTVAVYSKADALSLHTQLADEAICIGEAPAKDSYLNMERILSAAIATGAQAIHPGFGFLSENSKFAGLCEKCGIKFIGPGAAIIDKMGDKANARKTMEEAGVPITPGSTEMFTDAERALPEALRIGFPVMIKAAFGGGGKGMRIAENAKEFIKEFNLAKEEADRAFGNGSMYIEKFIAAPKHVEVQIIGDSFGNVVALGERDCSIQRRHQKMIEESPCSAISDKQRKKMTDAALKAAKAVGYESAGTIEFLLDRDGSFYFMEMNTRVQVEHPVSEMVTGVDIIKEMISVAAGGKLSVSQKDIRLVGHAIECRINAENPEKNFIPSPGTIKDIYLPGGMGVRVDSSVYNGAEIPIYYDSMIAKLIVHGRDRDEAIDKLIGALGEVVVEGVKTNVDFLYEIITGDKFRNSYITTDFIGENYA